MWLTFLACLLCAPTAHAAGEEEASEPDGVEAIADDPTRYAGRLVASVVLVAGEGTLPEADLEPLLRMSGRPRLDLAVVATDLRTLYRVAPIAAVEAEVRPAPVFDPDLDDVVEGVALRYVLYPAIRVDRVRVQGARDVSSRRLAGAARLRRGDPYDPDQDGPLVAERVRSWLAHEGYPEAAVEVSSFAVDDEPFLHEVWLRVDEGPPRTVGELDITGLPDEVPPARARRWLAKAGVEEGEALADEALTRARLTLRQKLARLEDDGPVAAVLGANTLSWLRRRGVLGPLDGGWTEASVRVSSTPVGDGAWDVDVAIEPGPRLTLVTDGISVPDAQEALGIDERLRLTRGFVEEGPRRVEGFLEARGYEAADAKVYLERDGDDTTLVVEVDRGPRTRRRAFRFEGNDALSESQLRTVFNQASPEIIRRGRLTDEALQDAIDAAESLYRSIGYPDATLTAREPETGRRLPVFTLDRSRRWQRVTVDVDEGPRTTLRSVTIAGAADDVDLTRLVETADTLAGGPASPQGLRGLAQQVVLAHRAQGYLAATADVEVETVEEQQVEATLVITPGDRIRLRSFATRGNRRVDSPFLRRMVAPPLGAPLTASTLSDLRQDLYDLGMFSGLDVSILGDGIARDLVVDLQERPRHTIEAGLGLASDQGVRALGRWTWRNVLGPADRIDTNALVGLRFATATALRAPEYRLGSAYHTPLSRRASLTLNAVGLEQIQERNWRSLRRALGAQLELHPARRVRLQAALRLENRRLADADPGALLPNDIWRSERLALPEDPSVDTRGRWVDIVELVLLRDGRDNPLQPRKGFLLQSRAAFSPSLAELARDKPGQSLRVPTLAMEARAQGAVPLGGLTLQIAAEGGHQRVLPLGELPTFTVDGTPIDPAVPVEQRYRLGGTASLRGFRRDAVGAAQRVRQLDLDWPDSLRPVITEQVRSDDVRWVPTGGDTYGRVTADLILPLPLLGLSEWDGYAIALFVDAGQTWFADGQTVVSTATLEGLPLIRVGTGLGLRVTTPVGPLQADVALNPQAMAGGPARTELEEPPARLHLSLGTLF